FIYDDVRNVKTTITYATLTNLDALNKIPMPSMADVTITKSVNDRTRYECFNANNFLAFSNDEENYVIEHRYNALNQEIATIAYASPMDAQTVIAKFVTGESLPLDISKDRFSQNYYDQTGKKIFSQDAAGYITEYKNDKYGNEIEKIIYSTKTAITPWQKRKNATTPVAPGNVPAHDIHEY